MRQMTVEERRARLALRHHLAPQARADDATTVARDLVALHGTDPASVFLALWARVRHVRPEDIERALYDDRVLVRILGMRRTMFVVPDEVAPVVHAACTRAIAVQQRRTLHRFLEEGGVTKDPARWLREVEESTARALAARGEATAAELAQDEPRLRKQILVGEGKRYEALVNVSTRVLWVLAGDGRIIRGRPRGSWISTQYRWSPIEAWLPGGMVEIPTEAARAELARRWLEAFGPGRVADLKWWTGWTLGETRRALAELHTVEVDMHGAPGVALARDLEPTSAPEPWVALLPALDSTMMGWSDRAWFLGEHGPALFDRSGNAGPTVWFDGRTVGGWAQRESGEVVFRLFEDIGAEATGAVQGEAERLGEWLGEVRIRPRFRTALEWELAT